MHTGVYLLKPFAVDPVPSGSACEIATVSGCHEVLRLAMASRCRW